MAVHAKELKEPDFGPPTEFYDFPGPNLPGHVNTPSILVEGTDFPKGLPMLTTDFFEFGTSTNGLDQEGCGVEMGDAAFGLVAEKLGALRRRSGWSSATPRTRGSTATCRSARRAPSTCRPTGRSGTTRRSATGPA